MFSKKSVVIGWACSYLIILTIPIITIFINYYFNVQVIEKETVHASEQVLENLQECVDGLLEDELTFYNYIFSNELFNNMLRYKEADKQFHYDAASIKEEMSNYSKYNSDLFCCIYFLEKNYVVDSGGGSRSDLFYYSMELNRPTVLEYDEWKQVMTGNYTNQFLFSNQIYRTSSEQCLVYADTVDYYSNSSANVFVIVPVSKVAGLIQKDNFKFLITIDGKDVMCISDRKEEAIPENLEYVSGQEVLFDGERYVYLERASTVSNMSFKLLINSKEFWKEAQHTRNILFISITAAMILGLVCVVLLLRRNMQPLSGLLKKIGGEKTKGNEYAQMEAVYARLVEEKNFMHKRILGQNELIKRNELLALLKGRTVHTVQEEEPLFSLDKKEQIGLAGFEVPLPNRQMIEHDELLYFIIDNVFSELMEGEKFYKIEDGQYIFYLFAVPYGKEDAWKQKCIKKADYLCNFVEDKCGVSPTAAVSGMLGQRMEEIRFLYRDVMEAFEYQELVGGSSVVDTSKIRSESVDVDFSVMIEMALQKESVAKMQENVRLVLANLKGRPLYVCQMRALEIFQQVAKNIYEYDPDEEKVRSLFGYLEILVAATDKKAVYAVLDEILICAYTTMHEQEQESQKGIVDSVKEYVEANYADCNLNIKAMAANLGWNPKYISRVFREQMEMGILDYINNVRIDKAILLLLNRNYSIEEVSEKVGYASSKTFRRAFAKKMGVAPSKYKVE